ncbi:phosphoglyceromutase [Desulfocarbo indianensis]|nr:phosphoglyceromutase [Desulfocarbo indianensis]
MNGKGPVALIILDGWGIAPDGEGNAVTRAHTPFLDSLKGVYPQTRLLCYGEAVGLPQGQMGNSEVGHLNLGAGRVVYQDITRINLAVRDGSLKSNPALLRAMERVKSNGATLHFLGLMSDGGVHSLMTHLYAFIQAAEEHGVPRVAVHAFLDGRDTPPDSGAGYLEELQKFLAGHPAAKLATVGGRFWGMDRDKRWDRVEKHYATLVRAQGPRIEDPVAYVRERYQAGEYDEFVTPAVVVDAAGNPLGQMQDGDAAMFFNFRADRARELTWAFNSPGFEGFDVSDRPKLSDYVCMTQYDEQLDVPVAFPPQEIRHTLSEVVSQAGLRQLHIAETEKYAHVTFFLNGGEEKPFPGEDRVLVPSPKEVNTYDQKPQMSAFEVTHQVLERINGNPIHYDFIVMNYANGDMVGHTGDFNAARQAMEAVDQCLSRVIPTIVEQNGKVVLTADHGNAEQMIDPHTGHPYTAHTSSNPVPLFLIDPERKGAHLAKGALCDVAPTVLQLMGLAQPSVMSGRCLFLPGKE